MSTSSDGLNWKWKMLPVNEELNGLAYGQGSYVTVRGHHILQAFLPADLTVTTSGAGQGTVTSTPAGISCGTSCSATFPGKSTVTLEATAARYSQFSGWTGCDETAGPVCTVTMDGSRTVNANFELDYPAVIISKAGSGSGKVTSRPRAIDCGSLCTSSFKPGTMVTLTASADGNSVFVGWGGACAGKRVCSIKATEDVVITAAFSSDPRIVVTPAAYNYGAIKAGRKAFRTFRITNKGKPPLTIGTIAVSGTNSGEFPVRSDGCSGKSLAANGGCSVSIGFAPLSAGGKAATMGIPSNDPENPLYGVMLSGTGK